MTWPIFAHGVPEISVVLLYVAQLSSFDWAPTMKPLEPPVLLVARQFTAVALLPRLNPAAVQESAVQLDNKPVVKEESIQKIIEKIEQWIDLNLLEDEETGNVFWGHKVNIDVLKNIIKKILGTK